MVKKYPLQKIAEKLEENLTKYVNELKKTMQPNEEEIGKYYTICYNLLDFLLSEYDSCFILSDAFETIHLLLNEALIFEDHESSLLEFVMSRFLEKEHTEFSESNLIKVNRPKEFT